MEQQEMREEKPEPEPEETGGGGGDRAQRDRDGPQFSNAPVQRATASATRLMSHMLKKQT